MPSSHIHTYAPSKPSPTNPHQPDPTQNPGPPTSLLSAVIRPDDVLGARPMPKRSIFMTRVFTPREPYPQLAAIVSGGGM